MYVQETEDENVVCIHLTQYRDNDGLVLAV